MVSPPPVLFLQQPCVVGQAESDKSKVPNEYYYEVGSWTQVLVQYFTHYVALALTLASVNEAWLKHRCLPDKIAHLCDIADAHCFF